ncbi:MAG: hypothetical protein Q4Q04_01770 [Methanocorpusculum sp.]|nr:hypothetical protein [Methanocorpusculum sp.]
MGAEDGGSPAAFGADKLTVRVLDEFGSAFAAVDFASESAGMFNNHN